MLEAYPITRDELSGIVKSCLSNARVPRQLLGSLAALALTLTGCHGGDDSYVQPEAANRHVVVYHHDAEPLPATLSKACAGRPYTLISGGPSGETVNGFGRDVEEYLIECR